MLKCWLFITKFLRLLEAHRIPSWLRRYVIVLNLAAISFVFEYPSFNLQGLRDEIKLLKHVEKLLIDNDIGFL